MRKYIIEFILIILLIPIFGYIGWQAYSTYIKKPELELEGLAETQTVPPQVNKLDTKNKTAAVQKGALPEQPAPPSSAPEKTGLSGEPEGRKRNPFEHSLPIKIKKIQAAKTPEKKIDEEEEKKRLASILPKHEKKKIVLPAFTLTGIVWGEYRPRAIIDNQVYRIGDLVKGAKILDITNQGVQMLYQEEDQKITFLLTITKTGE